MVRNLSYLSKFALDAHSPIIARFIRKFRDRGVYFDDDFTAWETARSCCSGYDNKNILEKVLAATLKVKQGEAVFERDSVLFNEVDYAWPLLAGLMWAAARQNGNLNVLDFGGSLGSSYFQNRIFLATLPNVIWNVVEQDHYVEVGQNQVQEGQLRFYKSIETCFVENKPNVVLLSSTLQYLENPFDTIDKLTNTAASILIIDRTPFSSNVQDKLMIQRVPPAIYKASYPMWVFSKELFLKKLSNDWRLVATSPCPEGKVASTTGFEFFFEGLILESLR